MATTNEQGCIFLEEQWKTRSVLLILSLSFDVYICNFSILDLMQQWLRFAIIPSTFCLFYVTFVLISRGYENNLN